MSKKFLPVSLSEIESYYLINPYPLLKVDIKDILYKHSHPDDPIISTNGLGRKAHFTTIFINPMFYMSSEAFKLVLLEIIDRMISEIDQKLFDNDSDYASLKESLLYTRATFEHKRFSASEAMSMSESFFKEFCCDGNPIYINLSQEASNKQILVEQEYYKKIRNQEIVKNLFIFFIVLVFCYIAYITCLKPILRVFILIFHIF